MANNVTDLGKVGITLKGEWNSSTSYERLDTVTYEGSLYIAVRDNVGSQPSESNTNWMLGAKHGEFTEQQLEDFKAEVVAESKEEMDDYTDDKKTELDTYTGTKKTELDTYEGTKEAELNTYASGLKDDFDSNATSKTNAFNTNATSKTTAFDNNATAKTTAFDTNATTKTSAFDDNATAKTTAFDENAEEKTGDFNDNVDTKTAEFDAHVVEKEAEFDENVDSIQEQITDIQEFIDSELEQGITEKGTRADVNDSAKWYGELAPEGRTEQKQLSGKNLFDINGLDISGGDVQKTIIENRIVELEAIGTKGAQFVGEVIELDSTKNYTFSCKAKKIVCEPTGYSMIRAYLAGSNDGETYTVISRDDIPSPVVNTEYSLVRSFTGYTYLRIYLYNRAESTVVIGEKTQYYDIQLEEGDAETDYEEFVGGQASPSPGYPQDIQNVEGRSTTNLVKVTTDNSLNSNTGGYGNYSINDATHEVISTGKTLMGLKVKVEPSTQYSIRYLLKDTDDTIIKNMRVREYSAEPITSTDWSGESFITQSVNDSTSTAGYKSKTITTQENTQWILFIFYSNGGNTTVAEWQVNKGSMLLPYEPYFEGKRLEFNVCNKNLGNMEDLYKDMIAFNPNYVRKEVVDGKDCIVFKSDSYRKENGFCGLKGRYKTNIRYKLDCDARIYDTSPTTTKTLYINAYDSNDGRIGGTSSSTQDANWKHFSFVTNELSSLFYIAFSFSSPTEWCLANLSIVEYTGEEYKYVENKEQTIQFPLQEGQKLMEGDYLADDGVHHKKKQITVENITSITTNSEGKSAKIIATPDKIDKFNYNIMCNKALRANDTRPNRIAENKVNFVLIGDVGDTVEMMQQKFNGAIVEYELLEEVIDTYTEAQQEAYNKLKKLMLNQGVNHIWTETDGVEPNLQLTYYKSNKERLNNIEARLELLEN